MKKRNSFNIGGLICLIVLVYLMYRMLLHDDILPFSISAVQLSMNHWIKHWHFLTAGFMPVYVALVFFGAALCGIFFGSALQRWLARFYRKSK